MSKRRHHNHPHENHSSGNEKHSAENRQLQHEQIELLAYRYWEQRGKPLGDPGEDWYKAEHELARQRDAATRL